MKRGARRGQVSVFIIIGVVILIAIGVLLYLRSENIINFGENQIPGELLPVTHYVETCLSIAATEAITLAGVQGGYTAIPDKILNNPEAYIALGGDFKLPFWYIENSNAIPTIEEVAEGISSYTKNGFIQCIGDFAALNKSYSVRPLKQPVVSTLIKEGTVEVVLDYPMDVETLSANARLNQFKTEVPVRLGAILRLARALMEGENRLNFLEQKTVDLMAASDKVPFTSIAFSCIPKTWKESDVQKEIQQNLKANLPRIRVMKTDFPPFERELSYYQSLPNGEPLAKDTAEWAMLRWDPLSEIFGEMRVGIAYAPEWGMDFSATPSMGGEMKSSSVQGAGFGDVNLLGTCLQFYHFMYDVKYPVRFSIFDRESLENGYSFSFASPVIVYHNAGMRRYEPQRELDIYGEEQFCSDISDQKFSVFVQDAKSFYDLENVTIKYNCLKYTCGLGETEDGRLLTELPLGCSGGVLMAEKNGYLKTTKQIEGEDVVTVFMLPLKQMSVSVRKYDNETGQAYDLAEDERASVYLTADNQELYAVYEGEHRNMGIINSAVDYKVSIYLFKGEGLVGGYKGTWTVTPEELASDLEFKAYAFTGMNSTNVINLINTFSDTLEPVVT